MGSQVDRAGDQFSQMARRIFGALRALGAFARELVVTASGARVAGRAVDSLGDQFSQLGRRAVVGAAGISRATGRMAAAIVPTTLLANRVDALGDEYTELAAKSAIAGSAMGRTAKRSAILELAHVELEEAVLYSAIPALVNLLSILGPLTAALTVASTGVLGLASGFGLLLGTGVIAWGKQLADQNKQRIKQIDAEISKINEQAGAEGGLSEEQQARLSELHTKRANLLSQGKTLTDQEKERLSQIKDKIAKIQALASEQGGLSDQQQQQLSALHTERAKILSQGGKLSAQKQKELAAIDKEIQKIQSSTGATEAEVEARKKRLSALHSSKRELEKQTTVTGALVGALGKLKSELVAVIAPFGQRFIPLITAAVEALPELTRRILESAGNTAVFEKELWRLGNASMTVIPQLTGFFFEMGKVAIPWLRRIGAWLSVKLPAAFRFMQKVTDETQGHFLGLGDSLLRTLKVFTEYGVVATQVLVPAIRDVLEGFMDLLRWVMNLNPGLRRTVILLTTVAPAFVGVAVASAKLLNIADALLDNFGITNKLLPAIAQRLGVLRYAFYGVAAAATAVAAAYVTNFAQIRGPVNRVLIALGQEFIRTARLAGKVIGPILVDIANAFGFAGDNIEAVISSIAIATSNVLVGGIRAAGETIRAGLRALDAAWQHHGDVVTGAIRTALRVGGELRRQLPAAFAAVKQRAGEMVATVRTQLGSFVSTVRSSIARAVELWRTYAPRVRAGLASVLATVRRHAAAVLAELRRQWSLLTSGVREATTAASRWWNEHSRQVQTAVGTIVSTLGVLGGAIVTMVDQRITLLRDVGGEAIRLLGQLWSEHGSAIITTVSDMTKTYGPLVIAFGKAHNEAIQVAGALALVTSRSIGIRTALSKLLGVVVGAATRFGGLLGSLSTLGGYVPRLLGVLRLIGPRLLGLAGPIGVAAAAALTLYEAWQTNFFGIRDVTNDVIGSVKRLLRGDTSEIQGFMDSASAAMRTVWQENITPLIRITRDVFTQIKDAIVAVVGFIRENAIRPALRGIEGLWSIHGDALMGEVGETYRVLRTRIQDFINWAEPKAREATSAFERAWNEWGDELQATTRFTFDTVGSIIGGSIDTTATVIRSGLNIWQGDWEGLHDTLDSYTRRTFDGIRNYLDKWTGGLFSSLTTKLFTPLKGRFKGTMDQIVLTVREALRILTGNWGRNIVPLVQTTRETFGKIKRLFSDAMAFVTDTITRPALRGIMRLWRIHGDSLARELGETVAVLKQKLQAFFDWGVSVVDFFTTNVGRVWSLWGDDLKSTTRDATSGIVTTIRRGLDLMGQAWNAMSDELTALTRFTFDTLGSIIGFAIDGILTTIKVGLNIWQGDWEEALEEIASFGRRTFDGIRNYLEKWVGGLIRYLADNLFTPLVSKFSTAVEDVFNVVDEYAGEITSRIEGMSDAIVGRGGIIPNFIGDLIGKFKWAKKQIVGKNGIIPALVGGVVDKVRWLKSKTVGKNGFISQIAGKFVGKVRWVKGQLLGKNGVVPRMIGGILDKFRWFKRKLVGPKGIVTSTVGKVKGAFKGLSNKLVGNSIIPDMLDMTIAVNKAWVRPFLAPFEKARKDATTEFSKLESAVNTNVGGMKLGLSSPLPGGTESILVPPIGPQPAPRGSHRVNNNRVNITIHAPDTPAHEIRRELADELRIQNFNG